jgi:hypothetical protein
MPPTDDSMHYYLSEQTSGVHSGPNVISAEHRDTNESAELSLVWSLQFHKTGISFAAGRVIDIVMVG